MRTFETDMKCRRCDADFKAMVAEVGEVSLPTTCYCDACLPIAIEEHRLAERAEESKRATAWYVQRYPDAPTDTTLELLPPRARALLPKLIDWQPGPRGIVMFGPSGQAKTRLMHMLLRRLVLEGGVRALCYRAPKLGRMIEDSFVSDFGHSTLIRELSTVPVLAIDDLGKERLTMRVESDLFDVFESRTMRGLPLIITSNHVGDRLIKRFNDVETGEAIVRRIREFCEPICLIPAIQAKP
jgi:DNA replication protein DnaC